MSETGPAQATETSSSTEPDAPTDRTEDTTDWVAEARKWEKRAKQNEERAKANATAGKELEQLRQASMSDQEKAVAVARAEARAETLREMGGRLVDAEVRAAAAGRNVDVDALLEGLDRSRFVTADGEPDPVAITAWVDRIAPKGNDTTSFPDLGQGVRNGDTVALNGDPLLRDMKSKLGIA